VTPWLRVIVLVLSLWVSVKGQQSFPL